MNIVFGGRKGVLLYWKIRPWFCMWGNVQLHFVTLRSLLMSCNSTNLSPEGDRDGLTLVQLWVCGSEGLEEVTDSDASIKKEWKCLSRDYRTKDTGAGNIDHPVWKFPGDREENQLRHFAETVRIQRHLFDYCNDMKMILSIKSLFIFVLRLIPLVFQAPVSDSVHS